MKKLKKVLALALSLLMVGGGLAGREARKVDAGTTNVVVYTPTSKTAVSSAGTVPTNSSATYSGTYGTNQATSGNTMTLTLSGFEGFRISGVTLSMHSNSSKGAGTLSIVAGTTSIGGFSTAKNFNTWYNVTGYTTSFTPVNVTLTNSGYVVQKNEKVTITIACTTNSLYCENYSISYSEPIDKLSVPTATLSDGLLNITEDANASSYVVGFFKEGEIEPAYSYNLEKSTLINVDVDNGSAPYGTFSIKVKAVGDNSSYTDSDWSESLGTYTKDPETKTILDFLSLEDGDTYYLISGTVDEIGNNSNYCNCYINDGNENRLYIYGLKDSTNTKAAHKDGYVRVGDEITIFAKKSTYNSNPQAKDAYVKSIDLDVYYVTFNANNDTNASIAYVAPGEKVQVPTNPIKPNFDFGGWYSDAEFNNIFDFNTPINSDTSLYAMWNGTPEAQFAELKTKSFLGVSYSSSSANITVDPTTSFSYTDFEGLGASGGGTSINTTIKNYSFNSTSGFGNTSYVQFYSSSKLTISCADTITSISFTFTASGTSNYGPSKMKLNSSSTGVYSYNQNIGTWTGTSSSITFDLSAQVRVTAIVIEAIGKQSFGIKQDEGKNLVTLGFGIGIDAKLVQSLNTKGTSVTYGIAYKIGNAEEFTHKGISGAIVEEIGSNTALEEDIATAAANEHFYQYRLLITNIPDTKFNVAVTAKAYVCVDGAYSYAEAATYSVNSIAKEYVDNHSTDEAVKPHLEMLKWLSTYVGEGE